MIAPAVAKAAMDSGVATRPIEDFDAYRERLTQFVYHSGLLMKPIFTAAKKAPKRIVYAEGEDERVLRAVQVVVDEGLAQPILVGRPAVLERRIERFGLRIKPGVDFETINPDQDERYRDYWTNYYALTQRKGVSQPYAQIEMRRRHTLIGAMMIHRGDADGMLCGTFGTHALHLRYIDQVLGRRAGRQHLRGDERGAAAGAHGLHRRHLRQCRSHRRADRRDRACSAPRRSAASASRRRSRCCRIRRFGTSEHPSAQKMRDALALHQCAGARPRSRRRDARRRGAERSGAQGARSRIRASTGEANLLIMPTLDAANISFNLLKVAVGRRRDAGTDPARRAPSRCTS